MDIKVLRTIRLLCSVRDCYVSDISMPWWLLGSLINKEEFSKLEGPSHWFHQVEEDALEKSAGLEQQMSEVDLYNMKWMIGV